MLCPDECTGEVTEDSSCQQGAVFHIGGASSTLHSFVSRWSIWGCGCESVFYKVGEKNPCKTTTVTDFHKICLSEDLKVME